MEIEKVIMDIAMQVAKSINEPRVVIQQHHMVGETAKARIGVDFHHVRIIDVVIGTEGTLYLVRTYSPSGLAVESVVYLIDPDDIESFHNNDF